MSGFACRGCGCVLPPRERKRGRVREWCSERCRQRARRERAGSFVRSGDPDRVCLECGASFVAAHSRHRFCSHRCAYTHREKAKPRNPDWAAGRRSFRMFPCCACGAEFWTAASKALCPTCKADREKAHSRRKNARRRGARVGIRYTLNQIGERDGWRCHICRRAVDRTLPGSRYMGPTIDHLVPLSDGGVDEPSNVALAHRACNMKRGARGVAQLRLTG